MRYTALLIFVVIISIPYQFGPIAGTSIVIYSNEFQGSINPAQFWRKRGYTPQGLMDPYLD